VGDERGREGFPFLAGQPAARGQPVGSELPLRKGWWMNYETDWREVAGTVLCALLSLGAFVPLVGFAGWLPAVLAVIISLACPLIWLLFLLLNRGSGGGLRQQAQEQISQLHPVPHVAYQMAEIGLDG
jgi:hypothetical protein